MQFTIDNKPIKNWKLNSESSLKIPENLLSRHLVEGVDFLHENFQSKLKGSILNGEINMNFPLQVCTFLSVISQQNNATKPFLIVCPNDSLVKWHYHLNKHAMLNTVIVENDSDVKLAEQKNYAYLLAFSQLNCFENYLESTKFFCVIIDNLDEIVGKLITRKMSGQFNIGITYRNFYVDPDSKLRWKMLNWANPNSVGKIKDFIDCDARNNENFRNNYRFWWLRLTWNFCESFIKPNEQEIQNQLEILDDWNRKNNIISIKKQKNRKRKVGSAEKKRQDIIKTEILSENSNDSDSMNQSSDETVNLDSKIKNEAESPSDFLHNLFEAKRSRSSSLIEDVDELLRDTDQLLE